MTQDRAEFEAWARMRPREWDISRWPSDNKTIGGVYRHPCVRDAWEVWQAAKASDASPGDYTEGRKRLHEYLDENHGVMPLTDDLSEIEHIVLSYAGRASEAAQQADAEPVAWQYRFVDPISGSPIWRHGSGPWNAQKPKEARPLYTTPPTPAPPSVWLTSENGEHWPRVGDKYLVRMNGRLQYEIYEFDQGDDGCGGGEYFWIRDDLDECPAFNYDKDEWVSLADIDAMLSAAQEGD